MTKSNDDAWKVAIGFMSMDDIEPSPEFLALVEKEKRGEITKDDMFEELIKRHTKKQE